MISHRNLKMLFSQLQQKLSEKLMMLWLPEYKNICAKQNVLVIQEALQILINGQLLSKRSLAIPKLTFSQGNIHPIFSVTRTSLKKKLLMISINYPRKPWLLSKTLKIISNVQACVRAQIFGFTKIISMDLLRKLV